MDSMFPALALLLGAALTPGRLVVDPPTLENLGFRWYVEGDDNRNASVEVRYRAKGRGGWRPAPPLLRVHHEVVNQQYGPHRVGNLFAGSVLFLRPATTYEVELTLRDPDGGAPSPRLVTVTTRPEPRRPEGGRRLEARPGTLAAVLAQAAPGDTLLLHAGLYAVPQTLVIAKPRLVFRPAGDGEVILKGPGHSTDLVDLQQANDLWFENLTFRRARHALLAGRKNGPGASGLVVRRCRIEDVVYGITSTSEHSENWYVADNVITGINPTWYPRPNDTYMAPGHTGVNAYGRGHVVAYNRISRFGDGMALANFGIPLEDPALQPVAVDFHHNEIFQTKDDCIETDYGAHNIRVYRNRCYSSHTGLSVQPFYGGPVYLIGNEVYGVTALTFKLHNFCAGIVAWHNTVASARTGFQSFNRWQNGQFRNNLFLGGAPAGDRAAYAMDTGTITPYSTLDYDGFRRNMPGDLIRWYDGAKVALFPSLAAFTAATGHEKHGVLVDYDIFQRAAAPVPGRTYDASEFDLRLRPGAAAIDAGIALPGINDGFGGKAPDLGCYELGDPVPRYGPRP